MRAAARARTAGVGSIGPYAERDLHPAARAAALAQLVRQKTGVALTA